MAKKRKKKQNKQEFKTRNNKHKAEFVARLKRVFKAVYTEQAFAEFSDADYYRFIDIRYPAVQVKLASNTKFNDFDKRSIPYFKEQMDDVFVTLSNGNEISVKDFADIAMYINPYAEYLVKDHKFPDIVKDETIDMFSLKELNRLYFTLQMLCDYTSGYLNVLGEDLYWFEAKIGEESSAPNKRLSSYIIITLHRQSLPKSNVIIDGTSRPLIQMGFANTFKGFRMFTINAGLLNDKSAFADIPLEVYAQSHALRRYHERLDVWNEGSLWMGIMESFENPTIITDDYGNKYLEYTVIDNKIGYFLLETIDGKIILKTFLFITNSGTPEGKKLKELVGLEKLDKEFLNIDKLSIFVETDFSQNKKIKDILIKAGCQSLLNVYGMYDTPNTSENKVVDTAKVLARMQKYLFDKTAAQITD